MNNMKINTETYEIKIEPKEGFEIDIENSDLKNGKVILKEVKSKYPNEFEYDTKRYGGLSSSAVSEKYADKLNTLDTLLCLRDECNRIDGFEEGFRFGEENWCIANYNNELNFDTWSANNKIMHFGKKETAELFLNNFIEQLEQVKEFL